MERGEGKCFSSSWAPVRPQGLTGSWWWVDLPGSGEGCWELTMSRASPSCCRWQRRRWNPGQWAVLGPLALRTQPRVPRPAGRRVRSVPPCPQAWRDPREEEALQAPQEGAVPPGGLRDRGGGAGAEGPLRGAALQEGVNVSGFPDSEAGNAGATGNTLTCCCSFLKIFLYFILSVRGLGCYAGFSLVALIEGFSGVWVRGSSPRGPLSGSMCSKAGGLQQLRLPAPERRLSS